MGKNIIILSDGTSQSGGEGYDSNVYKLFTMLENRTPRQMVFYDPGIGTDFRKILGTAFGVGFSRNLLQCYEEIHKIFEAGDRIFLFGFSRGAATVRSLSGFIHLFGILPRSRPDLIDLAFKIYSISDKTDREQQAEAFVDRHSTMWARIRFLGCWDTVSALGFPLKGVDFLIDRLFRHKFHSFDLSESVEFARHAVAIDENRKTFQPVMWKDLPLDHGKRLKQVWFAGSHTDVGGGYLEDDLSNITLSWMIGEAVEKGVLLYPRSTSLRKLRERPRGDINGEMHNSSEGFPGNLFRMEDRSKIPAIFGKPLIHKSVFERKCGFSEDSDYAPEFLKNLKEGEHDIEPWDQKMDFFPGE